MGRGQVKKYLGYIPPGIFCEYTRLDASLDWGIVLAT
jgi:hypothetical protein